jgi:hypothetical protein
LVKRERVRWPQVYREREREMGDVRGECMSATESFFYGGEGETQVVVRGDE